jgi:hypothetical protein
MKKSIVAAVALLVSFTFTNSPGHSEILSPLRSQTEVTVKTLTGTISNTKVFPLANGSSLVTWQEQSSDGYSLKARTVSATNKLGPLQTLSTGSAALLVGSEGVKDTVAINRSGKLFAVWATLGIRYSVPAHTVWGRTSLDGSNWSKPFVVIPGLSITGNREMCATEPALTSRCGFLRLQSAIDDKGRLAVLVADNIQSTGTRYRMKSSSFLGKWGNFKTLSAVNELRASEILGLTSGFIVSATKYNASSTNSIRASYYDPKAEAWTNTLTSISINANTVITSHWVQRDTKNLTLAMASSNSTGGVLIRNFNVDSKSWTSELTTIQEREPDRVYQDLRAAKVGSALVVMFNIYNQSDGSTEVRASKVSGLTPTTAVVGTSNDQIDLLYAGSSLNGEAVIAYNHIMEGAKLGGITETTLPTFLPNTATNSYLSALIKTRSDKVLGVGLKYGQGTTSVVFTQGYVR